MQKLHLYLMLTYNCNLNCYYCEVKDREDEKIMSRKVYLSAVSKFLKKCKEQNVEKIMISFHGGEALLF